METLSRYLRGNPRFFPLAAIVITFAAAPLAAEDANAVRDFRREAPVDRDARMAWWREARFGMFIHWGLYAIPAGEWKGKKVPGIGEWIMCNARAPVAEYEKLAGQFNPTKFDAAKWVGLAKAAGMKYIVITSKHHDGFCLWDSKVSDYDIMAAPYKRDVLKDLAEQCRKQGVKLCFYHSIMDWHHPDAQAPSFPDYNGKKKNPNWERYVETYLKPQLKELITGYGPLGVLWFDGEWVADWDDAQGWALYNYCRTLQGDLIVNNRIGKSRKGMAGMSGDNRSPGDFGTPEQQIPATGLKDADWESCMTMNGTWGFRKDDQNWKSAETLIRNLVDCASKGGNYLLNVGPTAEGEIPQASVERLAAVGKWMAVNGPSVYGTKANPLGAVKWGRITAEMGLLYLFLHVFEWPKDGRLIVPGAKAEVLKAHLLGDREVEYKVTAGEGAAVVEVPAAAPDAIDTVIVLTLGKAGRR